MKNILYMILFFCLFAFFCTSVGSCLKGTGLPEGILLIIMILGGFIFAFTVIFKGEEVIEKTGDKINAHYVEEKEKEELRKIAQQSISEYQSAKNSFQYFSDEKLFALYQDYQNQKKEDSEMLALEEELIRRGVINHSQMHEKLYLLKKNLQL